MGCDDEKDDGDAEVSDAFLVGSFTAGLRCVRCFGRPALDGTANFRYVHSLYNPPYMMQYTSVCRLRKLLLRPPLRTVSTAALYVAAKLEAFP